MPLLALSGTLFASSPKKPKFDCTVSVTVTKSQEVTCDCGEIITLTATKISEKKEATCAEANAAAYNDANTVVTNYLANQVAAKNYICNN